MNAALTMNSRKITVNLLGAAVLTGLLLTPTVKGEIVGTCGDAQLVPPPPDVTEGGYASNDRITVFNEQQNVTLSASIVVDAWEPGLYDDNGDLGTRAIPAGTRVSSHYIHYDSTSVVGHSANGCVTFDNKIIGVVERDLNLANTNTLGAGGVNYPGFLADRGYELGANDAFTISDDGKKLTINNTWTLAGVDDLRVITCEETANASFTLPTSVGFCDPLILDGSSSTGETAYFLEVFKTDGQCSGNVAGPYWSDWFEGQAGLIDLRDFYEFASAGVYRVKLAVANDCTDWDESVQCVTIQPGSGIDCNANGVPDECEIERVLIAGYIDNFAAPINLAEPGPELQAILDASNQDTIDFDEEGGDRQFGHTFTNLPSAYTDIILECHIKAVSGCCYGPENDNISLQANAGAMAWSHRIGAEPGHPGLITNSWSYGTEAVIELRLSELPDRNGGAPVNLLPQIATDGRIDVRFADDTEVDYIRVRFTNDCNENGVLDDCEPDCDGDGTPNDCDPDFVELAITNQPASKAGCVGQSVTLSVSAVGASPLSYNWYLDGAGPVATGRQYTIGFVDPTDAGAYTVVITDACDSITSNEATLTVASPPTIITDPDDVVTPTGSAVVLHVEAAGTGPLNYQWRMNGVELSNGGHVSGADSATLMISAVGCIDGGIYDVVVTNSCGAATSGAATVTISDTAGVCPPSGLPGTTRLYQVSGSAVGTPWSWCIKSTNPDAPFFDICEPHVNGVIGTAYDAAVQFADSINAHATSTLCDADQLIAQAIQIPPYPLPPTVVYLAIRTGGCSDFELWVGEADMPPSCLAQVFPAPPCSFNPMIEEIPLPGVDCNENGWDDVVDLLLETSADDNGNGIPDECEICEGPTGDLNADGNVNGLDLQVFVSLLFGSPTNAEICAGDFNGNGSLEVEDIAGFVAMLLGD